MYLFLSLGSPDTGEEQRIGLDALGVENTSGQTENSVQITLIHQVATDLLAVAVGKKHIVQQYYGGPSLIVGFQAAVDVLEEVQLLVAGGESEVIPGGTLAALLGAEGRIGKHQVKVVEGFTLIREGVGQQNLTVDVVEHGIHQRQPMGVVNQLTAGEGFFLLELGLIGIQIVKIIGMLFDILMGCNHKAKGAAGGVVAQYETGSRTPKADLTAALAEMLDVSPHALSVPDIDSYVGLMHTLFTLEDNYGLKISEMDGEICLKVDVRKGKDAARLHEMLCSWQQAAAMLEAGEISKEDYDKWRYHYPEFDKTQNYVKTPPQDLV